MVDSLLLIFPLIIAGEFIAESNSPTNFRDNGFISDIVEGNSNRSVLCERLLLLFYAGLRRDLLNFKPDATFAILSFK